MNDDLALNCVECGIPMKDDGVSLTCPECTAWLNGDPNGNLDYDPDDAFYDAADAELPPDLGGEA